MAKWTAKWINWEKNMGEEKRPRTKKLHVGITTLGGKQGVVKHRHPWRYDGDDDGADDGSDDGCGVGNGGWWFPPLVVGGWGVSMARVESCGIGWMVGW